MCSNIEYLENLINNGEIDKAENLIYNILESGYKKKELYSILSVIHYYKNNLEYASKYAEFGLKIDPYDFDNNFNLAIINDKLENIKDAEKYFIKAFLYTGNEYIRKTIMQEFSNKYQLLNKVANNFRKFTQKEINILHGTMEIANQMNTYAKGLKKIGCNVKTLSYYKNYLNYKSDIEFNITDINEDLVNDLIQKNDIFHFHFGTSLKLDNSDINDLYKKNKTILMQHWGSDVRRLSVVKKFNSYAKSKVLEEEYIRNKLRFLGNFVKHCVVSDYELFECVKEYYENIYIIKQALNLNDYKNEYLCVNKNNKFTIVHAPTDPEYKGTKYIVRAIEELKLKYDFDFILVSNMPHNEAKKIYKEADLIIDQLHAGAYGLFAIESMALGKPVVGWISDYMFDRYPRELPIIPANPQNIKLVLEYLLQNKDLLEVVGNESRKYVEKYHDINKVFYDILELYCKIYKE
ncbi:hypothetical protein ABG79_02203 [Caloramator mitchellensis]|uniref:Uncharacterized protein n=1 Tax=Caloramator mitchellensis TaxID=908809 RepID=A0A0R3JR79_CALMK|nr:glycosyltransferase [Caloramator mitchellensis]KRQ85975.1 hypothetical protein ABG79_02203 [Caloramator mitchellensis]